MKKIGCIDKEREFNTLFRNTRLGAPKRLNRCDLETQIDRGNRSSLNWSYGILVSGVGVKPSQL